MDEHTIQLEHSLQNDTTTGAALERWVTAQKTGKPAVNFFEPPTPEMLKNLERTRAVSKELQASLGEMERTVRIAEKENALMNASAKISDYVENHEYVTANSANDAQIDRRDVEEEKTTQGNGDIQKFYAGQCVFVTGGTGFLGKVLIEKLLRTCSDLDTIYVLVRSKKGQEPLARLINMLDDVLFERLAKEQPKSLHKVVALVGDISLPDLGLSAADRQTLVNKVSIIINAAATVRFDEKLSMSTAINVLGTRSIVQLARECKNLKALTHVSTAFAHCPNHNIEERFYEPPLSVENLECISKLKDSILEEITPKLLGEYPNTYCFTKAVAEDAVRKHGEGMPICILRPGIVVSTYEEPLRGWTDNLYGPTGIMVGIGTGVLRTMYMDESKHADIVPVDYTVNAIIAVTWDTAKRFKQNQTSDIPIYNFVSSPQNPITWGEFIEVNEKNGSDKPTMKAVWYYGLNNTKNYSMFLFYNFFLHFLPALLIDVYFTLIGRKRMMLKLYHKMHRLSDILTYFSVRDWCFSDDQVRALWRRLPGTDRELFPFSMANMSWEHHSETLLSGLRVYLVKDDLSTLPEARKRWSRMYYMHQTLKAVTATLLLSMGYWFSTGVYRIVVS